MNRIGRTIPRRNETQSFSLSTEERERINTLHYTLLRVDAEDFRSHLQRAIITPWPNPEAINKLYEALTVMGVIQPHMIAGGNDNSRRHCVRCHKVYKEMENSMAACTFKRPILVEDPDGTSKTEYLHQYVSRHTTRPELINYDNGDFRPCEALGCAEGIPSRTPSPTPSDLESDIN